MFFLCGGIFQLFYFFHPWKWMFLARLCEFLSCYALLYSMVTELSHFSFWVSCLCSIFCLQGFWRFSRKSTGMGLPALLLWEESPKLQTLNYSFFVFKPPFKHGRNGRKSILATQQIWAVMPFPATCCCLFFLLQYCSWFGLSQMLCAFNVSRLHILHGSFLFGVFECWVFFCLALFFFFLFFSFKLNTLLLPEGFYKLVCRITKKEFCRLIQFGLLCFWKLCCYRVSRRS